METFVMDFFSSAVCRAGKICRKCRTDRSYREAVAKTFSMEDIDFPCPKGYKLSEEPKKEDEIKPKILSESEILIRMDICRGCNQFNVVNGRCKKCDCSVGMKAAATGGSCPIGKW
jgi:hypothetical protein